MFLVLSCSCFCAVYWSQLLSREWRCSRSSTNRQCPNYIWMINKFIAYKGTSNIRGFRVGISNIRGFRVGFWRIYMCYWALMSYYSTGVQIVSCTLSDDSVLSESTGLFNPVLCVSQWNLFWQKNQPMRLCLSNQVRSAREWFPSPLGDFIRLFEGLIGELFQIWHWNMFYFFKWHQSGP